MGALTAKRINILETKIFIRKDGIVIISANIEETEKTVAGDLKIWKNLKQDLSNIFEGHESVLNLTSKKNSIYCRETNS